MKSTDIFSIIANLFFSASAAGSLVLILFFAGSRLMKKYKLDRTMLKLAVFFIVLWIIDIGLYITLSIII